MLAGQTYRITSLLLVLAMTGCALSPEQQSINNEFTELYSGKMRVAHEAGEHEVTAVEAIANGDQALADGNTDRAMYQYVHALQLNGGDAGTLNKVGAIHIGQGNWLLAARAYAFSLRLEPGNAAALEGVGLLMLRERRYEDARQHLTTTLEAEPQRWRSHNGLGMLADLDGDHDIAASHYRQALDSPPGVLGNADKALLLNNLGYSLYMAGDRGNALKYFYRALDTYPGLERAWENLGLVYTMQGDYYRAADAYSHVMEKPQVYNNIGFLCMVNEKYDCAEYYFNVAIRISPSYYVKAHDNLYKLNSLR